MSQVSVILIKHLWIFYSITAHTHNLKKKSLISIRDKIEVLLEKLMDADNMEIDKIKVFIIIDNQIIKKWYVFIFYNFVIKWKFSNLFFLFKYT
jgi:hypothetical protein